MFAAVCYGLVAVFCFGVMGACSHRASGSSYRDDEDNYFSEEDNDSNQYMQKRGEPVKFPPPRTDEYLREKDEEMHGKTDLERLWESHDEMFGKTDLERLWESHDEMFGKKKDE